MDNSQRHSTYYKGINDNKFEKVEECKFLGVRINQDMSWKDQIESVIGQVAKACGSMYTIRTVVPQKILKKYIWHSYNPT